mmetsp:Transcript_49268/g.86736  ORF Transcript_49268/g.86736 Transcript_49268/m.86736 type:complete len:250 (-) Transcript_49268:11-760(-)
MNQQEPGQWLSAAGGTVMFVVVCLCAAGVASPWWTELQEPSPNYKIETEASLWLTFVRIEETLDRSTLNCEESCDVSRLGSTEVREKSDRWSKVCAKAEDDDLNTKCNKLWAVRVCILVAFFFALLYSLTALIALCGGRRGSSVRFPSDCGLFLGVGSLLACAVAIGIAVSTDMKLKMNGAGWYCTLVAFFTCIPGILISILNKMVLESKAQVVDVNQRPRVVSPQQREVKPVEVPDEPQAAPLDAWSP